MEEKEKRIRALTALYYSNPKVGAAIVGFSRDREVVPRYFSGFGKRPDTLQYPSDLMGAVRKGATSFHASEELWEDPFKLHSEITQKEMKEIRKGWDLLIDIDSPFLDCSKIAARLILEALEYHGVKNYGIKFSGSKGFHIIISGKAFPKEFGEQRTEEMFPEWPRAISEYLMNYIRRDYNKEVSKILKVEDVVKRTKLSREQLEEVRCLQCEASARKGGIVRLVCPICNLRIERKNIKQSKRKLRCLHSDCSGYLEIAESKEYYYCENCTDPENEKLQLNSDKHPGSFEKTQGVSAERVANLDLVLVAPRHLFRSPYSLHEKTALASVVLDKKEIANFAPRDADPMKVEIREFYPNNEEGEARRLLGEALDWKRTQTAREEKIIEKKHYGKNYEETDFTGVTEEMFPKPIKKLLKGLEEGKKRGLFVLLTFYRSLGFSPEYINEHVRKWNEKNEPPLREGYVRSQIDWHLRQKKKILPPNYSNESFYADLGLLDEKPKVKNPLVDVKNALWKSKR